MCVGVSVWLGWSGIRVTGVSGTCDYSVELPHWSYCSWFDVCWSFGVVGLEWYSCYRLIRSLRLFCWITTLVVLFLVRCVLEFRCGWVGVVFVLQAASAVPCQYTLSLMRFTINNQEIFQTVSYIHNINTRNKHHFRRPNANLSCFKKKYIPCWHKNFNSLQSSVTILKSDTAKFKAPLRKYLHTHSFYSANEFFVCKNVL